MSAGHGHSRPNEKHPHEVAELLADTDAPELMRRWQTIDVTHDMVDLAGYNVGGTTRFLDRDFVRALRDPQYAIEIGIRPIDTGLTPQQTISCVLLHEGDEKVILDADNDVDDYISAHEFATSNEHRAVISKGSTPKKYEGGLREIIAFCARKVPKLVPLDFCCAPLLDDPDRNDERVLKILRRLGVVDASKISKRSVDYGRAKTRDQCSGCVHWEGTGTPLSTCEGVEGLVRNDRWCTRFEPLSERQEAPNSGGTPRLPRSVDAQVEKEKSRTGQRQDNPMAEAQS